PRRRGGSAARASDDADHHRDGFARRSRRRRRAAPQQAVHSGPLPGSRDAGAPAGGGGRRRYSIGTLSGRTVQFFPRFAQSASAAARSAYGKVAAGTAPGSPTAQTIFMRTGGFGSRAARARFGAAAFFAAFSAFSAALAAASAAACAIRSE